MSKYTTEVRYICESLAGLTDSVGGDDVETIIANSREKVFNFNYPIFDATYKSTLETKILKHFYTREIAHETVGLWKLRLNIKMNEIMPYYNQLYKSELLEFNPFYDTEVKRNKDGTINKVASNSETTTQTSNISGTTNVNNTETTHDSSTVLEDESNTNTGTVKNAGTIKDTGTVKNAGTIADDGSTTNDLTDTTTATNTVDKTVSEDKLDAYSDTPQGSVSNLEDYSYLTNARKNVNSNTGKDTEKINESLKKTGTVDASNTTTTDMTRTDNTTSSADMTRTDSLSGSRNVNVDTSNDGSRSGNVNGTNTSVHSGNTGVVGNSNVNDIESYIEEVVGKQGGESYSSLLLKFRETFLNIDMMVIGELNELFFTLW